VTPALVGKPAAVSRIVDLNSGVRVADRLQIAATFSQRLLGLMGRRSLDPGEGLLLLKCRSVHTCFMRFPIDVAYLDEDMWVLAVHEEVQPWRFLRAVEMGEHTLELPAGTLRHLGVKVGHRLTRTDLG